MFHNDSNTHYDSVIRTCSSSKCSNMAEAEYNRCLLHPRDYWFQGCSLRSCCKDRDLCNGGSGIHHYLIYTTITMQILLLVTWPEGYSCVKWFFFLKLKMCVNMMVIVTCRNMCVNIKCYRFIPSVISVFSLYAVQISKFNYIVC